MTKCIGEYRIIGEKNGSGTTSDLVIGEHVQTKWIRAIKVLRDCFRPEVLIEEAKKQMAVSSLFVVPIYDLYTMGEQYAIVMEYCPRGMDNYFVERFQVYPSGLPVDEALKCLRCVWQGLIDAHEAGVIHGDLKPPNIRYRLKDVTWKRPLLADFGAGRLRGRHRGIAVRGSSTWLAPEVLDGEDPSRGSDFFSFGELLYLALTGRHPFFTDPRRLTTEADNIRNANFTPIPLSVLRDDIPDPLANVAMNLMSRDISLRLDAAKQIGKLLAVEINVECGINPIHPVRIFPNANGGFHLTCMDCDWWSTIQP